MTNRVALLLLLLSALTSSRSALAQDYWSRLTSPTPLSLKQLSFVDSARGWVVGDQGVILHTEDGGNNWSFQNSGVQSDLVDVFFLDENRGWALTWTTTPPFGTIILETTDGGANWNQRVFPIENKFLQAIFFRDPLTGWAGGFPGDLFVTIDGGSEWDEAQIDSGVLSGFPVLNFAFFNDQLGYASGGHFDLAGVIWRTTNGGQSWSSQGVGPEPIQQLFIFDSLNVIGVGGDFEFGSSVVRSSDAGESWEYRTLEVFGVTFAVSFRNRAEGWAPQGLTQKFLMTLDSAQTWQVVSTPDSAAINDLVFTDSLHGYAVGDSGVILKYNPQPVAIIHEPRPQLPSTARLEANYPNPFNPSTIIPYFLPQRAQISLRVYDVLGREVTVLVEGVQEAGRHQAVFSGEKFSSGIYYAVLRVEAVEGRSATIHTTGKMLLLK